GVTLPEARRPVVGGGYLLPRVDGRVVFGATTQADDPDPAVRDQDHRQNLARLAQLGPSLADLARLPADRLQGRTGFRCVSRDRLPLVGAVPQAWVGGPGGDWDQPRFVPRAPGLYLCTALGSRGITVAPLVAELLAATITGAPLPLPSDLVDAVDPARFVARATRRRAADRAGA
ncbi:MAG: FAD-dependent oxidoreductase, partial [Ideonella sp.]|nr:FAD-dependent oxidoreductase [Ideonella sp.]